MISIARTFGAPESVPAGSTERSASIGADLLAQRARPTEDTMWITCE